MRHLGLAAILVFIFSAASITLVSGRQSNRTISQHVAMSQPARIIFAFAMIMVASMFAFFFFGWLGPRFGLSLFFYILAAIASGLLLVAGLFPYTTKIYAEIHQFSAWCLAYLTLLLLVDLVIETFQYLPIPVLIYGFALIIFATIILIIHKSAPKVFRRHALYLQSSYILGVFGFLIMLTYIC
jgi:MFS family permease